MTKAPTPKEMSKGQIDNRNNATKKFEKKVRHKKVILRSSLRILQIQNIIYVL